MVYSFLNLWRRCVRPTSRTPLAPLTRFTLSSLASKRRYWGGPLNDRHDMEVPPPPIPSPPPSPTLPPCAPRSKRRHPPGRRPGPHAAGAGPSDSTSFFLQIESRAWRVPSQLRIRKSNRMPPTPMSAPSQERPCPVLFPFVEFTPFLAEARRPTFGPRPRRYDLSPFFDRFNSPQRAPRPLIRPVPVRYDLSAFVDLSVAPQTQAGPRFLRHGGGEKTRSTIQLNSNPATAQALTFGGWPLQGLPCLP